MSPIDEEVRSAIAARTDDVTPPPDLFAGVEHRVRRDRRRRVATGTAATVLAVGVLLGGGSTLLGSMQDETSGPPAQGPTEAPAPTAEPEATPTVAPTDPYELDLTAPWGYRGDAALLDDGTWDTIQREWLTKHAADAGSARFFPLFGQVYEPSASTEVVYLAVPAEGQAFWGLARSSESGPEFVVDQPVPPGATALVTALPGDEVARLLVLADPDVAAIEYGPDDASEWSAMHELEDGVAVGPLEGDPATDSVRVLDGRGTVVHQEAAADVP